MAESSAMGTRLVVAIPCYNAADWIDRTLSSIFAEIPAGTEVVIVDDGSTDASVERIRAWGSKVRLETGPNRGACHARNRGLAIAEELGASHIVFFDADDYLEGPMLAGALDEADRSGADMVLSNMHLETPQERTLRYLYSGTVPPETFFEGWMAGDYVNPSGILWRTSFVRRIGAWDESLARAQDLEIVLRALFARPLIVKNERGAAIHTRVNPNSISRTESPAALDSRLRALDGFLTRLDGSPFENARLHFHREIYATARAAFRGGHVALGQRATAILARERYRRHHGTLAHRLAARVLGLERKVKLWGA